MNFSYLLNIWVIMLNYPKRNGFHLTRPPLMTTSIICTGRTETEYYKYAKYEISVIKWGFRKGHPLFLFLHNWFCFVAEL